MQSPKIKLRIPMMPSILKEIPGYNTNIEPIVNPIIQKNVCVWKLSKRNLISFIHIIEPIPNPIANGISNGRYKEATETR